MILLMLHMLMNVDRLDTVAVGSAKLSNCVGQVMVIKDDLYRVSGNCANGNLNMNFDGWFTEDQVKLLRKYK